jgi:signal transduction histidine kinase/DNA-binding NarL/FixJ family response regulator
MKREVSCRIVQTAFQYLERQNKSLDGLLQGVPYSMEHLCNKHEWIDWDSFATILSNARKISSDTDIYRWGAAAVKSTPFFSALITGRFIFRATRLLLWWNRYPNGPAHHLITCIRATASIVGKNRVVVTLEVTPGHRHCSEFFLSTKGSFTASSTLIGLEPCRVEMMEFEGGARYDIECPEAGLLSLVRRIHSWPFPSRLAAQELKESTDLLAERYAQLEEMQAQSQRQVVRLKVAYDIIQLINNRFDLDSVLHAITDSLVNVAGFAGAFLAVDAVADGRMVPRTSIAGSHPNGSLAITRSLMGHGVRIGEATLWLVSGADANDAGELLDYVIPIIAMKIDDAKSFTLVNDYRESLQERTQELREANEALRKAQTARDRFFANISHEFRTPLTLILGPAEQGLETVDPHTKNQKFHAIRENARRLLGLVNQLLDFARLESGSMKLQVASGDVVPFLRRVVMSFESWAERKKIDLAFLSDVESQNGYLDGEKVEKIVNNLVSNAVKFTGEGGIVIVTLTPSPSPKSGEGDRGGEGVRGGWGVRVTDTGPGIAVEHLPHIFDRFYRIDETHSTEGTGIGLALTKELVELHHGTIAVESTPGKGSVFTVTLPIERSAYKAEEVGEGPLDLQLHEATGDRTPEGANTVALSASLTEGKPVLLVVEDHASLRQYIRENLTADFAVLEAEDGKVGYDRAMETVPDLVISDVMMPEMDGMELCRALKRDVRTSHIPVILLTARAGTDNKIEGLSIGADDYVTKPFEMKELLVRVRNLIDQRRLLRTKFSAGAVLRPGEVAISSLDDVLLKKVMNVIEQRMGDENLGAEEIAKAAALSRRQLDRKLLGLTSLSIAELVRYMRLQRARDLLEKNAGTVAEIAYQVGFTSPSYFATCFHDRFGSSPSELMDHHGK